MTVMGRIGKEMGTGKEKGRKDDHDWKDMEGDGDGKGEGVER